MSGLKIWGDQILAMKASAFHHSSAWAITKKKETYFLPS